MPQRPQGYVDGFAHGDLRGWIVNVDEPDVIETVVCRNPEGVELRFCPLTVREDVVRAIGRDGMFGFALSGRMLRPLGPSFAVMDRYGNVLENGSDIHVPEEPVDVPRSEIMHFFMHIPKTAGTSLRNTLFRGVPPGEVMLVYPDSLPALKFHHVPLHQRNTLRWIFGHFSFGLDRFVTAPSLYITFVRDPVDRLRSNFAHHVAAGTLFEVGCHRLRPSVVINHGLSPEFDNLMTRMLANTGQKEVPLGKIGRDEVELALTNARKHFAFIGRHDQMDTDVATLQEYLGLPAEELAVDNVTPPLDQLDEAEFEAVSWREVIARNWADSLLYSRLEQDGLLSRVLNERPG